MGIWFNRIRSCFTYGAGAVRSALGRWGGWARRGPWQGEGIRYRYVNGRAVFSSYDYFKFNLEWLRDIVWPRPQDWSRK